MMNGNGYSLADIAAATGGSNNRGSNDGWGGDGWGWIWIILIFAVFFGWGGFGNGGFGGNGGGAATQGALTREQACIDNNFQNLMRETAGISDAVNVGFANLNSTICQQQYDTAQMINGLGNTIQNGFNAANIVALQNQNALQAQLAQCCCENREGQAQIRYDMATQACATQNTIQNVTRDIIDNQNANSRAILDYLCQDKIATLQSENQALRLSASQQAQNNYLISQLKPQPVPAYPAASPCGLGNWSPAVLSNGFGYNGGCGCACGNAYGVA